ncbi:hypothetical protein MPTK1_7g06990 [Marchantia polymorpha subsp. ruderalis]|uniref:Amino acid transporter transmembrane domain-containing protein n=2 Tax=Marchantia polymorpha TaxID=3197 RepID=A0AAF6BWY0_MARPO|nr:hypothetical protein MARPO_0076s0095 [Marchantia polymorpha]BBN16514.1 hypothetical protein Mp_7g06990 [Marchantia polymorpha subsp. ruderalis]|eukprot:PTQ34864.1 hypothetical protein MARPO_0076s0095 [Marchantia polymorpha]
MAPSLQEPLLSSYDDEITSAQENGVAHLLPPVTSLDRPLSKVEILESFDHEVSRSLQTDLQTIINTINLYVGVGILSLGYAVRLGGWASMVLQAVLALLLCYSAKLICRSFDRVPPNLVPSYPNLGHTVFGVPGQFAVMLMGGAEFFGALCLCLIVIWQSITMLLPSYPLCLGVYCMIPMEVAILGSTLIMVPAVLIRTFSRLTSLSISGVISSLLLTSVVIIAYAMDPQQKDVADPAAREHEVIDWDHLPMAAGIMIVSLSGHAGVPSLRRSMKNPENFERCISIAFFSIYVIYSTIGGFAYLYFGEATQVLITGNLNDSSSVTGFILLKIGSFTITINQLIIVLVATSAYTTCPALVYVVAELIVDLLRGDSATHIPGAGDLVARTIVLGLAYVVAIVAYDVLDNVESIVGGVCSVSVSLFLPALFYFKLYNKELSSSNRTLVSIVIIVSAAAVFGIGGMNVWQLFQKER